MQYIFYQGMELLLVFSIYQFQLLAFVLKHVILLIRHETCIYMYIQRLTCKGLNRKRLETVVGRYVNISDPLIDCDRNDNGICTNFYIIVTGRYAIMVKKHRHVCFKHTGSSMDHQFTKVSRRN